MSVHFPEPEYIFDECDLKVRCSAAKKDFIIFGWAGNGVLHVLLETDGEEGPAIILNKDSVGALKKYLEKEIEA